MLNAVIRLALRYRMVVVALSLAVLGYGTYTAATLPIDVFPDLDRPRVVIMTEAVGLAPEEVEALVSFPLESALLGATGVTDVRSQSGNGLSVVYVEFSWGTNIRLARQVVQERLTTLTGTLPEGVTPQMAPISSIMGQIVVAGLYRRPGPGGGELAPVPGMPRVWAERLPAKEGPDGVRAWRVTDRNDPSKWEPVVAEKARWLPDDPDGGRSARVSIAGQSLVVEWAAPVKQNLALRTLADWVVRPRLLKIPGVAQVITMGGGRKQYQVLVDPAALQEYGVSLQEVEQTLKDNNLNASGGYAERGEAEKVIRVIGRLGPRPEQVIADLRDIPVKVTPLRTILLAEVATVTEGPQVKRGDGGVNGFPGVVLTITKQPGMDTRAVTDRIEAALREAEPGLPDDVALVPDLFQLRKFIDRGVFNVGEALVIGAVLVLVVLFVFLMNVRTTFISLSAIPLALAVTALVFKAVGWLTGTELSINVMTLGGIAVAMGELVDDAIVDVENIFRRLGENASLPEPRPALRVIYEASLEVRSAIVFGTVMVILVFLPLFALSGVEGRLFTPLGVAYIVSILASLLVSLTVTPVMSYYLLAGRRGAAHHGDSFVVRGLKWAASYLVRFSMRRAVLLLALTWVLVGLAVWELTRIGGGFLPDFDEGSVQVGITLPPGSSLEASNRVAAQADAKFRSMLKGPANPKGELLRFVRRTGRAELDEHAEPPNVTEYILAIDPAAGRPRDEVLKDLLASLKNEVPGADIEAEQPLAHLISHMLSGVTAQIAIKVYGDDLDTLQRLAAEVKAAIQDVPGMSPPVVEPIQQVDELHVRLKPEALARYGVPRDYAARFVQTALQGQVVSQVLEGQRRFDLLVRLEEPYRTDYARLGRLRLDLPDGRGQVELGELADIGDGTGANQVKRDNVRRRVVIKCNTLGRDLQGVVGDIERRMAERVKFPEGYFPELGGQFESQRRATYLIVALALVSLVGMFVVLYVLFPSWRVVLQVLNAIPTAFIGGVAALALTGQPLTVAAQVGFISLGGIAARNGILLVTHYLHLMRHEGERFTEAMVLRGSLERLSPVLMTALTAGIGLVPLVVAGHEPGREILYPVATVILGGLVTSTFCEFLIHPGLFWRFSGRDAEGMTGEDEADGLEDGPAATTGATPRASH